MVMRETNTLKKKMIRLVFPIAFQQFMIALVGASDAIMLGKLSQNSMSAVSLASQVTFVFNLFMTAFVIGENMFIAQYYGKRMTRAFPKYSAWFLISPALLPSCFAWYIIFFWGDHAFSDK